MKILLAPDKFKGSLIGIEVSRAAEEALREIFPAAEFDLAPIADGGEGTVEILHSALGGRWCAVEVSDPYGRKISTSYSFLGGSPGVAVMEMSSASGLAIVSDLPRAPKVASTRGTGEMMLQAAREGAEEILLGIGGSATNDGGAGMALAFGYQFLDASGSNVTDLPNSLLQVERIVRPAELKLPRVRVACDVTNPLLGEEGASAVYGPQKGVLPEEVAWFEARLEHLADLVARDLGVDPRARAGAGAAGGLGFGLMAFCDAEVESGFELIAEVVGLPAKIAQADLVVTGEGRIDSQTLSGKGPSGVGEMARAAGVPCVAICGAVEAGLAGAPFDLILPTKPEEMSLSQAMSEGANLITRALVAEATAISQLTNA